MCQGMDCAFISSNPHNNAVRLYCSSIFMDVESEAQKGKELAQTHTINIC